MANNLQITNERVKAWNACAHGYRWFLEKFPQGGEFFEVYAALHADKKYDDSGWLAHKVFAELDTPSKVQQIVLISGADKAKIKKAATDGTEAATTGNRANAATTGAHAVAAAVGIDAKAKASTGGAIVLVHRNNKGDLLKIRASKVGDNGVKPDVWYSLNEAGEFVEVL